MKRLWDVLVLTLAVNFVVVAAAVGWLHQTGRLTPDRVAKVREVLFPPPALPVPTTQPAEPDATTRPALQLEQLLARHSSLPAGQQAEMVRQTFDMQRAELERRDRELTDLKSQVDLASAKLAEDRAALDAERKTLTEQQEQARKLAADQGFQDSLNLYATMPPRQVKGIFLAMSDDVVMRYLEAMPPRTAAKITKEFKSPDETDRLQRILEKMRRGEPTTQESKE